MALHLPALAALQGCARDAALQGEPFRVLTPEEGATFRAFAHEILPPDEFPGGVDPGAAHFADRVLDSVFPEMREFIQEGLADLDRRAGAAGAGSGGFAALSRDERVRILEEVEETPFFGAAHFLVVSGVFADPSLGGNRDGVGWALIGMEHAPVFQPPFGHYDAQAAAGAGEDA